MLKSRPVNYIWADNVAIIMLPVLAAVFVATLDA